MNGYQNQTGGGYAAGFGPAMYPTGPTGYPSGPAVYPIGGSAGYWQPPMFSQVHQQHAHTAAYLKDCDNAFRANEQAYGQEPGSSRPSTSTSSKTSNKKPRITTADFFVKHADGHKRILRLLQEILKNFPAWPHTLKSWEEIHTRLVDNTQGPIPSVNCVRTYFVSLLKPYLSNLNDGGKDATESKTTGNPSTGGEHSGQVDTLLRELAELQFAENNRIAKGRDDAAREVRRKEQMQQLGKGVMGPAMNRVGSGDFYRSDQLHSDDNDDNCQDDYDDDDDGEDAGPREDPPSGDRPRLEGPSPQDRPRARPAIVGGGKKKRRRRESGYDPNHINTGTDANEGFFDEEEDRKMAHLFKQADELEVRREERQAQRDDALALEREKRDARLDERMGAFMTQMTEHMGKQMNQMCQAFVGALAAQKNGDASPATAT